MFEHVPHIVQENETLFSIANQYNMTTLELAKLNNIPTTYKLEVNQPIQVVSYIYRVEPDEDLNAVAKKFGITPRRVAGLNGLGDPETAEIRPGQSLRIG